MPRLIVNADDFGLTPGINRAVLELHRAGALSSATLMAKGAAFDEAVSIAHACPDLGVGCHVVLVDGAPVSPPEAIDTLIGRDGKSLRPTLRNFVFALASENVMEDEIVREAIAQVRLLQQAGIRVTHLDTHKHTHMFPTVLRALLRAAEMCGVPCVRNPFEPEWSLAAAKVSPLRSFEVRSLRKRFEKPFEHLATQLRTTDGSIGVAATGAMTEEILGRWLTAMPEGTWELVTHPGYQDAALAAQRTRLRASREQELRALADVIPRILRGNPKLELIHYGALRTPGAAGRGAA